MTHEDDPDPVQLPINGELDLHTFRPSEIGSLIPEFLRVCCEQGFKSVRIVHGKGTGALREGVHRVLEREKGVERFALCGPGDGGWGATRAWLKRPASQGQSDDKPTPDPTDQHDN